MKNLNQKEATVLANLSAEGKAVFSFEDAFNILGGDRNTARKFLSALIIKGWLKSLERGKYLIVPLEAGTSREWSEEAFVIASHLANPYAISYWSALNYWGLTEQITQTVFVSTTRRKFKLETEALGVSYRFIKLSERKFFGFTGIWFGDKQIQITDKEKTIVDCLDHPEYCGGMVEASKGFVNGIEAGINLETLTAYAKRLGNSTIFKRLGYLSEILDLPVKDFADKWRERIGAGYSLFDPGKGVSQGRYYSKWNLRLNVSEDELINWREH